MAQPITWKNINQPNLRAANLLSSEGSSNVQKAIQGAAGIFNQMDVETTAENTEEALAQIRQLKTMNAYNEAEQAGRFSKAGLGAFGGQVDQSKVNKAFEGQRGASEASARDDIQSMINQGNLKGARDMVNTLEFTNEAGIYKNIIGEERASEARDKQAAAYDQQQLLIGRQNAEFDRLEKARLATNAVQENIFSNQIAQDESDAIHREDLTIEFAEKYGNNAIVNAEGIIELTDAAKDLPDYEYDSYKQEIDTYNVENKRPTTRQRVADTRAFFKTPEGKGISAKVRNEIIAGVKERHRARKTDYTDKARRTMLVENAKAKDELDEVTKLEDRKHIEALARLPVTYDVTNEMENIKKGDTMTQVRKDFSIIADNLDSSEKVEIIDGMNDTINAGYNGTKYPGWVIDEAYRNIGIEGIFKGAWHGDTINFNSFKDELDNIMQASLEDKTNRDKRSTLEDLKQDSDARRSAAYLKKTNTIRSNAERHSNI